MPVAFTPAKVIEAVRKAPGTRVKVAVSDIDGILRGKYMHKDKFASAAEGGFGFCDVVFGWDSQDVCYDNTKIIGWHKGFPTHLPASTSARIAMCRGTTTCRSSWANSSGRKRQGGTVSTVPAARSRVLKRAEKLGLTPMCGWNSNGSTLPTPQTWAAKKGSVPNRSRLGCSATRCCGRMRRSRSSRPCSTRRAHSAFRRGSAHGNGPGVYEAAILFPKRWSRPTAPSCSRPRQGDRSRLRHHAELHGEMERQLSRLLGTYPSIVVRRQDQPLLRPQGFARMSKLFESYLAGQVAALMQFAPMFWPTINSYKRLVDGFWAPVKPTWVWTTAPASFRVIPARPNHAPRNALPGADVNPYLARWPPSSPPASMAWKRTWLTAKPITGTNQGAENIPRAPRTLIETRASSKNPMLHAIFSAMSSSIILPRRASGNGGNGWTASPTGS